MQQEVGSCVVGSQHCCHSNAKYGMYTQQQSGWVKEPKQTLQIASVKMQCQGQARASRPQNRNYHPQMHLTTSGSLTVRATTMDATQVTRGRTSKRSSARTSWKNSKSTRASQLQCSSNKLTAFVEKVVLCGKGTVKERGQESQPQFATLQPFVHASA